MKSLQDRMNDTFQTLLGSGYEDIDVPAFRVAYTAIRLPPATEMHRRLISDELWDQLWGGAPR